jgi:hypothetical protein
VRRRPTRRGKSARRSPADRHRTFAAGTDSLWPATSVGQPHRAATGALRAAHDAIGCASAFGAEARGAATVEGVDRYAFHDGTVGLYFMGFANTQVRVGQPDRVTSTGVRPLCLGALNSGFRFCVLPIASLSLDRTVGAAAAPRPARVWRIVWHVRHGIR